PDANIRLLYIIIGVVLAASLLQGIANFALTQTISKAGQRLIANLRVQIHHHVSRLSIRYYDRHRSGEIVSRVMNDVEGIRNLVGTGMVEFLGGVVASVLALMILFYLNWQMTLAILVFIVVFLVVIAWSFISLGPIFKERQRLMGDVSGRLTEGIGGVRVVKSYNRESVEREVFARGVDGLLATILRTINGISFIVLFSSIMLGLLAATILYIGGHQLLAGSMTTGELISYLLYLGFLIAPMSSILMIGTQLSEVFAGLERMREVMAEPLEDSDEESREPVPDVRGEVQFENVTFSYEEGNPVLQEVSFTATPGTVTALVGPSGSGKSTLIGLVASFHQPDSGRILIDGRDMATLRLHDFRAHLGCVLQDNFLFSGTIRENILYARPDAHEEDLVDASRRAHALEFIQEFADGFDTLIGERGVRLSGGQRQRLAIARALLANPRLLILDEATSSLDSESEALIQQGLHELMEGRTTFVIAHRLSTIREADQILVLEDGRITERGTHSELLAKRGRYFEMYQCQYGQDALFIDENGSSTNSEEDLEETTDRSAERRQKVEKFSKFLSGE
ncbi:MAG: ABC transporter ATP-binding protein, partial [Candidatus Sumerlaeia bacterium]|nr:ABC transporter ATP-binding protein [Candidatus Sumerlaeia bacterium]